MVSGYLTYAKLTSNPLFCLSNRGCDIVQNSKYAQFLGIPVGIWGMMYYFVLFALLHLFYSQKEQKQPTADTLSTQKNYLPALTNFWLVWGLLFSTYLTYLEAFVIYAYCMWCLISFANIILICLAHWLPKKPAIAL